MCNGSHPRNNNQLFVRILKDGSNPAQQMFLPVVRLRHSLVKLQCQDLSVWLSHRENHAYKPPKEKQQRKEQKQQIVKTKNQLTCWYLLCSVFSLSTPDSKTGNALPLSCYKSIKTNCKHRPFASILKRFKLA